MGLEHNENLGGACGKNAQLGLMRMLSDIETGNVIRRAEAQHPELTDKIEALNGQSSPEEFAAAYAIIQEATGDPEGSLGIFTNYIKRRTKEEVRHPINPLWNK